MKGLTRATLAILLVAACGRDGDITGPNSRDQLMQLPNVGVLAIGVDSTTGASIETNKDDYAPGEIVHVVGRGWAPGETVNLHMTELPDTHADVDTNVTADAAGGFSVHYYDVQTHDLGVTFTLTATGQTSYGVAVAVFTDGDITSLITYTSTCTTASTSFASGAVVCAVATINGNSNENIRFTWTRPDNSTATATVMTSGPNGGKQSSTTIIGNQNGNWSVAACKLNPQSNCTGTTFTANFTVGPTNVAPVVSAGNDKSVAEGTPISLGGGAPNGATATDGDGDALTYAWTIDKTAMDAGANCVFGPGTATDLAPTVTCDDDSNAGTVKLTLTVDDGKGHIVSDFLLLTVTNANPSATHGGPYGGSVNTDIALNGSGNDPGDHDDAVLQYSWSVNTFGFGTCSFTPNSTTKDADIKCTQHSAGAPGGVFKLSLTVTDDDGGSSGASTTDLTITNEAPTVNAGGPYTVTEGSSVTLSAASATDPNGDALTYTWTVNTTGIDGVGSCAFTPNNTSLNPSITCNDDSDGAPGGKFTLTLSVDDGNGHVVTDDAELDVNNANPVANANGNYSGTEGGNVSLTGSKTDAGTNDTHTYEWTYALGAGVDAGTTCTFSNDAIASPTVSCTDDGTFTLTLKVTDDDGGFDSDDATLTLANANPVANANGDYNGAEGGNASLTGSKTDAGSHDTHTYKWTYALGAGFDAGMTCTFSDDTALSPTISCNDDGTITLTLKVTDDDGGIDTDDATLALSNANPVSNAHGDYTGAEGANVSLTGSFTDAGSNDTHEFLWSYALGAGVDAGTTCTFSSATAQSPTVSCTDDGTFTLTLKVTDDDGGFDTDDATLTLSNAVPSVTITSPADFSIISLLSGAITVTSTYTDAGSHDTHECEVFLDGAIDVLNAYSPVLGSPCSRTILPVEAGLYDLTVRIKDDDGGVGSATINIIVYDPSAGFVTGGGWINSPLNAYKADLNLTGKANFGFVSKYKRGATVPEGNTEFQFHAGSLNFHSSTYDFLIVNQAGTNAQFKGRGTINGAGSYTFMLWATDGGNSNDKFRIQITDDNNNDAVVYDNGVDQVIAGGSIVIHTGGKK